MAVGSGSAGPARGAGISLAATIAGLIVALAFPFVPHVKLLPLPHGLSASELLGIQGIAAGLTGLALLLVIITRWERLPLSSVGIRPLRTTDFLIGIGAFFAILVLNFVVGLLYHVVFVGGPFPHLMGIAEVAPRQTALLLGMPPTMMLLTATVAGCVEELADRGFFIERIEMLTGSTALAAVAAWLLPSALHIAFWGRNYLLVIAPMEAALVALYLWRRRLLPCVIAHVLVDGFVALVLIFVPLIPGAPSADDLQGIAFYLLGRQPQAIARFDASLALNPRDTTALIWRSNSYWNLHETKRSIDDLDRVLQIDPRMAAVYDLRALRQFVLSDYDAALADINKAIAIKPLAQEYEFKGAIDAARNDSSAAIEDLTRALSYSPSDAGALTARGRLYGLRGQNDRAIDDLTAAIQIAPSAQAYLGRGQALMAIGEWQPSYEDLKKSVAMNGKDPEALNALAWIMSTAPLGSVRNGEQAVLLATRACDLTSWKNPKYLLTLASAYAEAGDFHSAVDRARQGIDAYDANDPWDMLTAIDERGLYKSGHPYRMKPPNAQPTSAQLPQSQRN
ncbi:MAG TPA: tetratricopeptide repeat protein [Candidatus Binataceae bacterium]|nr:tetratricopeptide repeat protein [Candidatus Binataceae bacterium]